MNLIGSHRNYVFVIVCFVTPEVFVAIEEEFILRVLNSDPAANVWRRTLVKFCVRRVCSAVFAADSCLAVL